MEERKVPKELRRLTWNRDRKRLLLYRQNEWIPNLLEKVSTNSIELFDVAYSGISLFIIPIGIWDELDISINLIAKKVMKIYSIIFNLKRTW